MTTTRTIAVVAWLLATIAALPATAGERLVVVELFTSQGCNSCPPADRVLGELTQRPRVLPLSFHVTYWDRLGWPDTLGRELASDRQRGYAAAMGRGRVYTPQAVIGGRAELVGSRRGDLHEVIALLERQPSAAPRLAVADDEVQIGDGQGRATLWLVTYAPRERVVIERGENAGRTITYHNVVRDLQPLAEWQGTALDVALPPIDDGDRRRAVILQAEGLGPILAAVRLGDGA